MKGYDRSSLTAVLVLLLFGSASVSAQELKLSINSPDEPFAKTVSLDKAAAVLDNQSLAWTEGRKCGTCHTNFPYLLARPLLKGDMAAHDEVRKFFENRIANWDSGKKEDAPRWDTAGV